MDDLDKIYRETPPGQIPWNIPGPPELLVSLIRNNLIKPCSAVDLGCGLGNYAIWLVQQGFAMTAIDISPSAIATASEAANEKGLGIDFITADLTKPFTYTHKFMFAYDWEVLHHIYPENREQYMKNVSALLGPGGKYLSVCFSEEDPFCGTGKYRTTHIGTHLYFSSAEEMRGLFGKYFRILELGTRDIPGKHGSHMCIVGMMEKEPHSFTG